MSLFVQEFRKLLMLIKADPKSLVAGIIAPTVILVIFAFTFGDFAALKLAVVNEDAGTMGDELVRAIQAQSSPLSGEPYFELIAATPEDARDLYESDKVNGVLSIPADFSERLASGQPGQVAYEFVNYSTDMAKNLRLYLAEGILAFYQEHVPEMDVVIERSYAVPVQLDWFAVIAVGIFMLAFLMGSMFNFLYLLNKEREASTLVEYRLSPKPLLATFAARVVIALLAGLAGALVNAAIAWPLADVNLFAHLARLLPVLAVLGLAFVSFAALASLTVRRFSGAAILAMVSAVVIWFLSGATTSVKYAEGALLDVALALPSTYGLSQMREIVFGVDQSVGGMLAFGKGWAVMGAYAAVLLTAAYLLYRRRLSR